MSNQYFFGGEYKRKPVQNLSGRSNETREELLQKVQNERMRRERERLESKSIQIIQNTARGFIERRRHIKQQREDYIKDQNVEVVSLDQIGLQIKRLNVFFNPLDHQDSKFLLQLLGHLDKYSKELISKCLTDPTWSTRTIKFATKSAAFVIKDDKVIYTLPAKLYSFLKFLQKFMIEEKENPDNIQMFEFNVKLWIALLEESSIFTLFRRQFDQHTSLRPTLGYSSAGDMMIELIAHTLTYIAKLQWKQLSFRFPIDVSKFTIKTKQELLMEKMETIIKICIFGHFVENFTNKVLKSNDGSRGFLIAHFYPNLQSDFPWYNFAIYVQNEYFPLVSGDEYINKIRVHHLLYSTLCLASVETLRTYPEVFISLCNSLGRSMDPRYSPAPKLTMSDGSEMSDEELSDVNKPVERIHWFSNVESIYQKLREVFDDDVFVSEMVSNSTALSPELISFFSLMIRLEPRHSSQNFPILRTLAYNKDFLEKLFYQSLPNDPNSKEQCKDADVLFAHLFTNLMGILHDGEFLSSIPLSTNNLRVYIFWLVQLYHNMLINDTAVNQVTYSQSNVHNGSVQPSIPSSSSSLSNSAIETNYSSCRIIVACLHALHERNSRLQLFPDDCFASVLLGNVLPVRTHHIYFRHIAGEFNEEDQPLTPLEERLIRVLLEFPFIILFDQRIACWHRMIELDKSERYLPFNSRNTIQIRRNFLYEDTYEKLSPINVPDLRSPIRISLVNTVGALEAGVDGGGLLREFLTEATKAAVDPNRGLFRFDSQNRIYPNPVAKKADPDYRSHFYLIGRLVGKALYESTLLELPLAAFFIETCINIKVKLAVDYLATLDPGLHKQLLSLKTYSGDFSNLGLDFTITTNELGRTETIELKPGGSSIAVDKQNIIEYIHLVADYKINKEVEDECRYFRRGLTDVVSIVRMFSWREMQTLISGSDKPINIEDWQKNTNYSGGYTAEHPCVLMFWQVVSSLDEDNLRKLLKFVTSCSRPPLLGFKELTPNFGLQNAGNVDRLPSAATCMNLLKLPEYENQEIMREKLVYAINAQAGFELS